MTDKKDIIKVIYEAVDEINQQLPAETQLGKSDDTVLFGRLGKLDSLGLVNLKVAVEEKLEDELGLTVTIVDERAMSQSSSPFRTIETLLDYIDLLLKEDASA